jgi:hypothetical protein
MVEIRGELSFFSFLGERIAWGEGGRKKKKNGRDCDLSG